MTVASSSPFEQRLQPAFECGRIRQCFDLPLEDVLFLLGLIDYHAKTDAVEYVRPNEAV